jgi:DNA invertase Pin-like site-specific DNA recombinase
MVSSRADRLTRSLTDFAKLVELFDKHGVSFVSVTQQFNTTNSMGRLTLNVLLSFAQSRALALWVSGQLDALRPALAHIGED